MSVKRGRRALGLVLVVGGLVLVVADHWRWS